MPFFWDPTYIFVLIGAAICLIAQGRMKSTFHKFQSVRSTSGLTGRDTAERILQQNGLHDVQIQPVSGDLTDHYDPRTKTISLSEATYNSTSVAAIGVAAHECGHALQHAKGYAPLGVRGALLPVANFGSMLAWPVIIIGFLIGGQSALLLIDIGIILFSAAVLFQLVTLPVEFNASSRALKALTATGILNEQEVGESKQVLSAAALTYVAGAAAMILQLLRLLILRDRRQ